MGDSWRRIRVLAEKDAREMLQQPGLLLPTALMVVGISLPGLVLLLVEPRVTGIPLAESDFGAAAGRVLSEWPELARLDADGRAQAFMLQVFLMFSLLVPVVGALSLAAQAIVAEKQARSLEPLLTTPITVPELLLGKVLAPFVVALAMLAATYLLHLAGMLAFGERDVWRTLLGARTLMLFAVLGPLVSLTALLTAGIVSSRVNDARTAQQLGGFLALPITAIFIAQLMGQFLLGIGALLSMAAMLAGVNLLLLWVGVRVFQRETILMRWK
jgi:ABC-2 type transport system permease protein